MNKSYKQEIGISKNDSASIRNYLVNEIRSMVAKQLSLSMSSVLPEKNLSSVGLTSLDTIKISTMISLLLSAKISAAIMYGHKNIQSLARYLCERYPAQVENSYNNSMSSTQSLTDSGVKLKNNEEENTYSRSSQLQNNSKSKYYLLISGSSEPEIVSIARGIVSYIDKHHENSNELLLGLELYFVFERPQLFNRLAIVCGDLKSLKENLELYLSKKQSNCYRANGNYTFKNINMFKRTDISRGTMVGELFDNNNIDTIAYLWSNAIDIDIKSQYSQLYVEQYLPYINKIKAELSCADKIESILPSVQDINHNNLSITK